MINNNALTPGQPPRQHWRRSSYSGTSGAHHPLGGPRRSLSGRLVSNGLCVAASRDRCALPYLISLDAVDRAVCGVEFGSASMPSASSARVTPW